MKIDGIALLQMIKDEKIKENTLIEVKGGIHTHLPYVIFGKNKRLYWAHCKTNLQGIVLSDELIEYEFEIIEDKPKRIEEIPIQTNRTVKAKDKFIENMFNHFYKLDLETRNKLNEIIKNVNYILEKSDINE